MQTISCSLVKKKNQIVSKSVAVMTEFKIFILVIVQIATSVTDLVCECCFTSLAYFPIWKSRNNDNLESSERTVWQEQ